MHHSQVYAPEYLDLFQWSRVTNCRGHRKWPERNTICDVVIVVALCYYLESKRTGLGRCALAIWSARWQVDAAYILYSTNWTIDRLMLYAVNSTEEPSPRKS